MEVLDNDLGTVGLECNAILKLVSFVPSCCRSIITVIVVDVRVLNDNV